MRLVGTESVDGTGNELNNVLWGNDNSNTLTGDLGDDVLNGRGGADCMQGEADNDLYLVDNIVDQVMEKANQGEQDTVLASVSYALSENVENLKLDGNGNLNATGNDQNNLIVGNGGNNRIRGFAGSNILHGDNGDDTVEGRNGLDRLYGEGGNDLLRGFEASDTLDGGTGNDQMEGGSGNDTFVVDDDGDQVVEEFGPDTGTLDQVLSSISYTLEDNVEKLQLIGNEADLL